MAKADVSQIKREEQLEQFKKLLPIIGMKNILEELIDWTRLSDEDYVQKLNENLTKTLEEYENRYS